MSYMHNREIASQIVENIIAQMDEYPKDYDLELVLDAIESSDEWRNLFDIAKRAILDPDNSTFNPPICPYCEGPINTEPVEKNDMLFCDNMCANGYFEDEEEAE